MTTDLPGFAAPVAEAQSCFRAVLEAMAHPGRIVAAGDGLAPPAPLAPATGAVLLTLLDADTPVWLGAGVAGAADWIRFHCGSPFAEPATASFAVCLELPVLSELEWGSDDSPQDGATIILQCPSFEHGPALRLSGPGLQQPVDARLGLSYGFDTLWRPNRMAFPRGVDLIICSGRRLAAIPRSVHVAAA